MRRLDARLVTRLREIISTSKLTQVEPAVRVGLSQPDVSRLLRGQYREMTVERLMRMLMKLGYDFDIVVRGLGKTKAKGDTIHPQARLA